MFSTRKILNLLSTIAALGMMPAIGNAATAGDIEVVQTLNTSPLWADTGSYYACNVVNVTTSPITLTIELIAGNGSVLTSEKAVSVPAGQYWYIYLEPTVGGFARCRFTLNSPPGSIRANEAIFHTISTGVLQTYAVSEAR